MELPMNDIRELNCLELEAISAGAPKRRDQASPPTPPTPPPPPTPPTRPTTPAASVSSDGSTEKKGFIARVVAWKRKWGIPVLIPGY
jgi:hypothetical protein